MNENNAERRDEIRSLIEGFINERVAGKKSEKSDESVEPEVSTATPEDQEKPNTEHDSPGETYKRWLDKAAQRAGQIHPATHVLKGTHSDAKGTDLLCLPEKMTEHEFVGSRCLIGQLTQDVAGNAASFDVNTFLQLNYGGHSLLTLMQNDDPDILAALDEDKVQAKKMMRDFCRIAEPSANISSHTLAKQVYWLVGDGADPTDDAQYHLLSPLYASSLAHYVFQVIQSDTFGEQAVAAREAKKKNENSEYQVHEYHGLAIQKLGGSNTQNISVLNKQRKGMNYLLSSVPPNWKSRDVNPPYGYTSFFDLFGKRRSVSSFVQKLKKFLESDPPNNKNTRDHRDDLLDKIFAELFQYASELQTLAPGWSADKRCRLPEAEQLWLDKGRCAFDPNFATVWYGTDWREAVHHRFANWLNHALGGKLALGDKEHVFWMEMMDSEARNRGIADDYQLIRSMEDDRV